MIISQSTCIAIIVIDGLEEFEFVCWEVEFIYAVDSSPFNHQQPLSISSDINCINSTIKVIQSMGEGELCTSIWVDVHNVTIIPQRYQLVVWGDINRKNIRSWLGESLHSNGGEEGAKARDDEADQNQWDHFIYYNDDIIFY